MEATDAAESTDKRHQIFESLLESTAALILVTDPDGRLVHISQSCGELGGIRPAKARGRDVWEIGVCEEQQASVRVLYEALDQEDLPVRHESEWVACDGAAHTIEWRTTAVRNDDGSPAFYVSSGSDVTELRRAAAYELELAQTNRELKRSNADLESFAAVASHDLQEPLRKIQAFGDRLVMRYAEELPTRAKDYLERMQKASARMSTLIQSLLALSRVATAGRPFEPVDLGDLVHDVVSDLDIRLERSGGTVQVGDLPEVAGDPQQMRQLFQNLIGNALKFHREGVPPQVRITGECVRPLQTDQHVHQDPLGERDVEICQIIVEDNGIGFDEKYLDRVFEVFQRLHGRGVYEGTGMGLAICRRIVERHRGRITATSAPSQGSKFIVTFPTGLTDETTAEVGDGRFHTDHHFDGR